VFGGNVSRTNTSRLNVDSNLLSKEFRSVGETDPTMCVESVHSVSKRQAPLRSSGGILDCKTGRRGQNNDTKLKIDG
jgi:hypothetical protein